MEWIIWIVIIVGWAALSGAFSGDSSSSEREIVEENRFTLKVKEEIPPADTDIKVKCFSIKIKGMVSHPTDDQVKAILTITDNTDSPDDEFGPPVLSANEYFAEKKSRVFGLETVWKSGPSTYFPDWFSWIYIPVDFLVPPHKGKRKLKFNLTIGDSDTEVHHGAYENLQKIVHHSYQIVNFSFKDIGYMDELVNRDKVNDLTIKLGMSMAATDGHLDQKEINVIKEWAKNITSLLDEDKAKERNKHFTDFIKNTYKEAKDKKISLSKLVKDFNDTASKPQKYVAMQLLLNISSADGKLSKEEDQFINKIAKTTGIDLATFKQMKNKVIANVDKIDISEKPSEESFGITEDMDDTQKCKVLRKEFTKWNGQTNHNNIKKRKRAKEMVKIIANLRKQYNC